MSIIDFFDKADVVAYEFTSLNMTVSSPFLDFGNHFSSINFLSVHDSTSSSLSASNNIPVSTPDPISTSSNIPASTPESVPINNNPSSSSNSSNDVKFKNRIINTGGDSLIMATTLAATGKLVNKTPFLAGKVATVASGILVGTCAIVLKNITFNASADIGLKKIN